VKLSFRAKWLLAQVALVFAVGTMMMVLLDRTLAGDIRAVVERRLASQAQGAAKWVHRNRHPEHLVERLAAVVGARVAVLDSDGTVVADSEPGAPLEPHVARAEALSGDGQLRLRLTVSLADVDAASAEMRMRLLLVSLLGLSLAVALGVVASKRAAEPILGMIRGAERLTKGDYAVEFAPGANDELGELSRSLSTLSQKLARDLARIDQLERVRREVFANVAHELRTPVTAIQGFSETLLDGEVGPEQSKKFLEAIGRQSVRLTTLVAQLLRLSALESRAPEDAVREPVDVAAIAEHSIAAAKARGELGSRTLESRLDMGLTALGDPLFVEQVLDNLLDNAIRYGGPNVAIEGERSGARVRFRVMDDGPGIAEQEVSRLFERFYRVPGTGASGTGLGLSIVKHLCEAMGGGIAVTSIPGRTAFEVDLPSSEEP